MIPPEALACHADSSRRSRTKAEAWRRQMQKVVAPKHNSEHARAGLRLGEPYGSERAARVGGYAVRRGGLARPRKLSGE
jgi:hypothetical protein